MIINRQDLPARVLFGLGIYERLEDREDELLLVLVALKLVEHLPFGEDGRG